MDKYGRVGLCFQDIPLERSVIKSVSGEMDSKRCIALDNEGIMLYLFDYPSLIKYRSIEDNRSLLVVIDYPDMENLSGFLTNEPVDNLIRIRILYLLLPVLKQFTLRGSCTRTSSQRTNHQLG